MRLLILVGFLLAAVPGARAEDPAAAIQQVIRDQIEAFEADDFAAAFAFASPTIQQMFGDPTRFGRMVAEGYPMVTHPRALRFLGLLTEGGHMTQPVLITDAAGALYVLDYDMVPLADGWRIGGVRIRAGEASGA